MKILSIFQYLNEFLKVCGIALMVLYYQCTSAADLVEINSIEHANHITIEAKNISPAPVTLQFKTQGRNINSKCEKTCWFELEPGQILAIEKISPVNEKKSWRYRTEYSSFLGSRVQHYDQDYIYLPPFAHGEKFYLSQGFNGSFSHKDTYAIDFTMPEGTPIHAAREGKVLAVVDKFKTGGKSSFYIDKANYIAIEHSDGTVARYSHLTFQGAKVSVGETIQKGQFIGLSGQTGYGSGPHLHFEITRISPEGKYETLPFLMQSRHGSYGQPKLGYYYSIHPGQPMVEEIYADEIDFSSYFDKIGPTSVSNIKDKQITIDDHTLVYIQNGKSKSVEVEFEFNLNGFESLRPIPEKLTVQSNSEVLVAVIRPANNNQKSKFTYRYKYWE